MDSDSDLIDSLISEGEKFTWANFCMPSRSYPNQYAGDETPNWITWKKRTVNAVKRICSDHSPARTLVVRGDGVRTKGYGPHKFEFAQSSLLRALHLTHDILESDVHGELRGAKSVHVSPALSNRIFIVHGHDAYLATDVERFVREIGLEPVILHRQVDEGATIIEKFEKNSDVGFVFVLLTPDEMAYTIDQDGLTDSERNKEVRARPNVIFEFGYFVGRLGRSRVCCLHKGEVTVPSDLDGLVYKKVEDSIETQAYSIIRELRAAGYDINL